MPVALADSTVLDRLNDAIGGGQVKNRGGAPVTQPLDSALLRQDGQMLYPIRDDIPVMLIDEAIHLDTLS